MRIAIGGRAFGIAERIAGMVALQMDKVPVDAVAALMEMDAAILADEVTLADERMRHKVEAVEGALVASRIVRIALDARIVVVVDVHLVGVVVGLECGPVREGVVLRRRRLLRLRYRWRWRRCWGGLRWAWVRLRLGHGLQLAAGDAIGPVADAQRGVVEQRGAALEQRRVAVVAHVVRAAISGIGDLVAVAAPGADLPTRKFQLAFR